MQIYPWSGEPWASYVRMVETDLIVKTWRHADSWDNDWDELVRWKDSDSWMEPLRVSIRAGGIRVPLCVTYPGDPEPYREGVTSHGTLHNGHHRLIVAYQERIPLVPTLGHDLAEALGLYDVNYLDDPSGSVGYDCPSDVFAEIVY